MTSPWKPCLVCGSREDHKHADTNYELRYSDGRLDEIVATQPRHVHLEQMADNYYCLIIDVGAAWLMIDIGGSSRTKVQATCWLDGGKK